MQSCFRMVSAALLFGMIGCASAPRPESEASPRLVAPQMTSSARPNLSLDTRRRSSTGRAIDVRIEVMIDADGRPDLNTLLVTGHGAAENRGVLSEWIRMSTFRPGELDGRRVAALYKTTVRASRR